jgi:hypothetical protein
MQFLKLMQIKLKITGVADLMYDLGLCVVPKPL